MTICTHAIWITGRGKPGPACPRCGKRRVSKRMPVKFLKAKARNNQQAVRSHETTRRETLGLPPLVRVRT